MDSAGEVAGRPSTGQGGAGPDEADIAQAGQTAKGQASRIERPG
jgi:hypothetical protein